MFHILMTVHLDISRLLSKNLKIKIYRTIILHVVLYGCETWSLTLREECRLRVFENSNHLPVVFILIFRDNTYLYLGVCV